MTTKIHVYPDGNRYRVRRSDWPNDAFEVISIAQLDDLLTAMWQVNQVVPATLEVALEENLDWAELNALRVVRSLRDIGLSPREIAEAIVAAGKG